MGIYYTKIEDFGYKEKVTVYDKPMHFSDEKKVDSRYPEKRRKYMDLSDFEKEDSDDKRIKYYQKKVIDTIEIALMNQDLNMMVTLTFKDAVKSYNLALVAWQSFLKRLRHYVDKPLKYICVWEFQEQRGGVYHFHCLMNIGFIEQRQLQAIWGNGFVWIKYLGNESQQKRAVLYSMKYIVKNVADNIKERGKRYIFTSNNLNKPTVFKTEESLDLDEIVFLHMEDMVRDGSYDFPCFDKEFPVHAVFVEYRKNKK